VYATLNASVIPDPVLQDKVIWVVESMLEAGPEGAGTVTAESSKPKSKPPPPPLPPPPHAIVSFNNSNNEI